MDAAYIRRVFGNFLVTNNRALGPSDYDRFSVTVPQDPRLPGGGGFVINDLYDLNPARTVGGIPQDNYRTFSDTYGITIAPGEDEGLILAVAVAIDELAEDSDEDHHE